MISAIRSFLGLKPRPITPELVINLWNYMSKVYGTTVMDKNSRGLMTAVSVFLDKIGIQDKETFMKKYTTTIGCNIYTPFTVGVPNDDWSLYSQIVVCAHEHQHVVQSTNEGDFMYSLNYLTRPDMRAKYETEAYRSSLEFSWFYYKRLPDLHTVAQGLSGYGLGADHIHVAEIALMSAARMIQAGLIVNQATKTALSVLA
jgi:hypothetical protein